MKRLCEGSRCHDPCSTPDFPRTTLDFPRTTLDFLRTTPDFLHNSGLPTLLQTSRTLLRTSCAQLRTLLELHWTLYSLSPSSTYFLYDISLVTHLVSSRVSLVSVSLHTICSTPLYVPYLYGFLAYQDTAIEPLVRLRI
jgi:hypothetical protein